MASEHKSPGVESRPPLLFYVHRISGYHNYMNPSDLGGGTHDPGSILRDLKCESDSPGDICQPLRVTSSDADFHICNTYLHQVNLVLNGFRSARNSPIQGTSPHASLPQDIPPLVLMEVDSIPLTNMPELGLLDTTFTCVEYQIRLRMTLCVRK